MCLCFCWSWYPFFFFFFGFWRAKSSGTRPNSWMSFKGNSDFGRKPQGEPPLSVSKKGVVTSFSCFPSSLPCNQPQPREMSSPYFSPPQLNRAKSGCFLGETRGRSAGLWWPGAQDFGSFCILVWTLRAKRVSFDPEKMLPAGGKQLPAHEYEITVVGKHVFFFFFFFFF